MRIIGKIIMAAAAILFSACNYNAVESDSLVEKGIRQYEGKNFQQAAKSFMKALEYNPNNDRALYYSALTDMEYDDYKKAIENLRNAIGIAPKKVLYQYELGIVHSALADKLVENRRHDESFGEYAACIRVLKKAIELDPYYTELHIATARCQGRSGAYREAAESYQNAINADPFYKSSDESAVHYKELGELYSKFGFYDKALAIYNSGIVNNNGDVSLEIGIADVYRRMKKYEEALAHYELAAKFIIANKRSKLQALPAMYGAGMALSKLAAIDMKEQRQRQAYDRYASSRDWLMRYVEAALSDDERIRRSEAARQIKKIDAILVHEVL